MTKKIAASFLILGLSTSLGFATNAKAASNKLMGDGISPSSKCWSSTRPNIYGLHSNHWLVPKSVAMQGVGSYEQSGPGLLKNYVRYKSNHYYKWYFIQDVLRDCRRSDVIRWVKANTSSAQTMRDYLYLGLSWKVALRSDSPLDLIKSWCKTIPIKQKESINAGFPSDVHGPLIACQ